MDLRRIEEASLNAWPATQQILFDGWLLRFSQGYTKRANSVNPLYESQMDAAHKIAVCEALYRAHGLPPIFRLTPFAPPELDRLLEARGYRGLDLTHVLWADLNELEAFPRLAPLRHESLDDWLALFCRFSQALPEKHRPHREILAKILTPCAFAVLWDDGGAVACGLAVLENDHVGLFDLITDPAQRNRGYGTQMVAGLLGWARQNGARRAFLQMVSTNEAARRLYAKFGFREAYQYWYRISEIEV